MMPTKMGQAIFHASRSPWQSVVQCVKSETLNVQDFGEASCMPILRNIACFQERVDNLKREF